MASLAGWAGAGDAGTAKALHVATVSALWAKQPTAWGAAGRAAERPNSVRHTQCGVLEREVETARNWCCGSEGNKLLNDRPMAPANGQSGAD